MSNPRIFRYFTTSPKIIRLAVMMDVQYPLSLWNVEDLLHERGIDKSHPPPATAGLFNPAALQADCPGYYPAAVAPLLEVVLTETSLLHFTDERCRQAVAGVKITRRSFGHNRSYPIVIHFRDGGAGPYAAQAFGPAAQGAARLDVVDF
jgi:hypothetical protein